MKRIQRIRHLTEAEAAVARETRRQVEAEFPSATLVKALADALQFLAAVIETAEAEDADDASTHALVVNHGLAVLHNGVEALRAAGVEFEALKDEPPFITGQRVRIRAAYLSEGETGECYEVVNLAGNNRVDIRWLGWDLAKHGPFPPVETVGCEMIEPVSN